MAELKYCKSVFAYNRLVTEVVTIGDVELGGENPVRIQSMTNTNTLDTDDSVEQIIRIADAGADFVRLTAQGVKEAENLKNIKSELARRGYKIPLVADIHFNPKAAETAAAIVEKVRINPGNYIDRAFSGKTNYNEAEYKFELEKIHEKLLPLIKICKENGTAIRIGTNHGSLSSRIVGRYGDTPAGMVESAMEFLNIFLAENFRNIVLSMKSSNTIVMVQAYRMLAERMVLQGTAFPLHLGVTEAGNELEGRLKSAAGIGVLLADGIGDTIRVSLSESPENEIPVAKAILRKIDSIKEVRSDSQPDLIPFNPGSFIRRKSVEVESIGGNRKPIVVSKLPENENAKKTLTGLNFKLRKSISESYWLKSDNSPDLIFTNDFPEEKNDSILLCDYDSWIKSRAQFVFPVINADKLPQAKKFNSTNNFIRIRNASDISHLKKLQKDDINFITITDSTNPYILREIYSVLEQKGFVCPVINHFTYNEKDNLQFIVDAAIDAGIVLIDGLSDGVWIENQNNCDVIQCNNLSFAVLQACRQRYTKTEYIICPTCGRTQFDIEKISEEIKKHTSHLKGLKIGIMGCIVNGPGEMADADYGYVGAGPGKVSLYKGKTVVKKAIPEQKALQELITLIKEYGEWFEPENIIQ